VFETENGSESSRLEGHTALVSALHFDHAGERLLSGGFDGSARVWSLTEQRPLRIFNTFNDWAIGVGFSADDRAVLLVGDQGRAARWQIEARAFADAACRRVMRDLTRSERLRYSVDNSITCP
jgi:WD40 repeat protein